MLTIRLSRVGKKKKPMYRLIISEKAKDPYGRALEILGSYNPFTKDLQIKTDRVKHWLSKGSQMSATVNNLLIEKKIIEGKKVVASKPGKKKEGEEEAKPEAKESAEKPAEEKSEAPEKEADKAEEKLAEEAKE